MHDAVHGYQLFVFLRAGKKRKRAAAVLWRFAFRIEPGVAASRQTERGHSSWGLSSEIRYTPKLSTRLLQRLQFNLINQFVRLGFNDDNVIGHDFQHRKFRRYISFRLEDFWVHSFVAREN